MVILHNIPLRYPRNIYSKVRILQTHLVFFLYLFLDFYPIDILLKMLLKIIFM